jgi:thiamine biosynthesis lipoprotein
MSVSTSWQDWSCLVRVTLADGDNADLAPATRIVRSLMDEVAGAASRFVDHSDLNRVNAAAGTLVPVSSLALRLVEVALEAARRTQGAVDPTVGAHLLDAGYVDDIEKVRARKQRAATAPSANADWSTVRIDREVGRIGVPAGLRLDLGASAKAWTADEGARRVRRRLGHAVLVGIGGDLAFTGASRRRWRIDVSEVADGPAYRIGVTHGGLATSSVLGRAWESTRGTEHHVIDPTTGRPARGSLRTATVWAGTALAANTWSTAALVWGDSAAARLHEQGVAARLIDHAGAMTAVGAWPPVKATAA